MIKAIFFDLDGTLTNTLYCLQYVINTILTHQNKDGITIDQVKKVVGDGAKNACIRSLKIKGIDASDDLVNECLKEYKKLFSEYYLYKVVAYDGIKEVLCELKKRNIKIFCITNKPEVATKKTLDEIFGINYFEDYACDDGKYELKPCPDATIAILKKYNLNNEECLFVGDTHTDIETANNAKIKSLGALWGFRDEKELKEANATYIIKEPKEILNYI
ncbi:MAG: HAD family hydrolase [Eubacteriales bacterium]|nr:HAD family hydrolase [Eubacteriales bacterium]